MAVFDGIEGQSRALSVLERALADGRLSSSYLFEGPSGVGKERTAVALATEVVAAGDPRTRERLEEGNHPDLRVFRPRDEGNRNIQVETVRSEILPFTQYAPFEAEAAFVLFPEADLSFPVGHPESANALLKTLEEPRPRLHFILISDRPDRLLDTIRSRCQRLRFDRLSPEVLDGLLAKAEVPAEDRGPAIALAGGRADRALSLATDGLAARLLELTLSVDAAALARKPGSLLDRAEDLAKADDLRLALETLGVFYRDLAGVRAGLPNERLRFRHAAREIRDRARHRSVEGAALAERATREAAAAMERNANPQITLDAMMYRLAGLDRAPRRGAGSG